MALIRRAVGSDSDTLTDLAVRSEAHWGFGKAFMDAFRETYGLTPDFVREHPVYLAEEEGQIAGFYALSSGAEGLVLDLFYVDPSRMGAGLGRQLWHHLVETCRSLQAPEVHLVCGPEPKAFYLKMGAVEVGEAESRIAPGRRIFRLVLTLGRRP